MARNTRREKQIIKMMKMANKLVKNYSWELNQKLWDMCSDWNSTHDENDEIFMCETCDDNDNVNGFMIEDDVWYWQQV